ncbi:hypothetical protein RJ640_008214 [Escallonia rubra]|uniref:Protein kinase domain-containing protein n=1 Tax=Escallonia rubra TaxID=112253 RepID=A0AA88QKF4_9ASTE|nr:hypothetical protein RJ640_008214 [Escallonia rubra]
MGDVNRGNNRPEWLQQYDLIGKIGEGTYGLVFLAKIKSNRSKSIAIKKFKQSKDGDGVSPTAIREIMLLREITHENVVKLVNVHINHVDMSLYLAFDYAEHDLYVEINGVNGSESNPTSTTDPHSTRVFFDNKSHFVDPDPGHSFQAIRAQIFGSNDTFLNPAPMNGFAQHTQHFHVHHTHAKHVLLAAFAPSYTYKLTAPSHNACHNCKPNT